MSTPVHSSPIPPDLSGYSVHRPQDRPDAQPRSQSQQQAYAGQEAQANAQQRTRRGSDVQSTSQSNPSTDSQQSARSVQDRVDISQEAREIQKLAARDREVRAHEAAHAAVGGQYAGAPSFTYQTGPDGKRYAVGGEVSIDTSPVAGDPEATIKKMQVVRAAANAPAEPSSTDRQVAAQASQEMVKARMEMAEQRSEEAKEADVAEVSGEEAAEGQGVLPDGTVENKAPGVRTRMPDLTN